MDKKNEVGFSDLANKKPLMVITIGILLYMLVFPPLMAKIAITEKVMEYKQIGYQFFFQSHEVLKKKANTKKKVLDIQIDYQVLFAQISILFLISGSAFYLKNS